MVLIFSIVNDYSTDIVVSLLRIKNVEVIRINGDSGRYQFELCDLKHKIIFYDHLLKTHVNILDARSVWYRKCGLTHKQFKSTKPEAFDNFLGSTSLIHFKTNVQSEIQRLVEFIHDECEKKDVCIGKRHLGDVNKLRVLKLAEETGHLIPSTYILNDKRQLEKILKNRHDVIITKAISDGIYHFDSRDRMAYYSKTERLTPAVIDQLPDRFGITKVQELLPKFCELRVFYFYGSCYSMAIFSQQNVNTSVDYRNYDQKSPNRCVPYVLTRSQCSKIRNLMEALGLNTGSIDFVMLHTTQLVFLEVNPVGQFGMVDEPCNYKLHELIANKLTN